MTLPVLYLLFGLVITASCLVEFRGERLLAKVGRKKQNILAGVSLASSLLVCWISANAYAATNIFVFLAALFAGIFMSRHIGSPGALSTLLTTAAIVDLASVYGGPTRALVNHARQSGGLGWLQYLMIAMPVQGRMVGVIGFADLMFFVVCMNVTRRFGWRTFTTLAALLTALWTSLAVSLWIGLTPGLPFLAAAIVANAILRTRAAASGGGRPSYAEHQQANKCDRVRRCR